jgi:hypothetical protein
MSFEDFKPALFIATLGVGSGLMSDLAPGPSFDVGPLHFHAILTGVWFALAIAAGVWLSITRSLPVLVIVGLATWGAWEIAANLASSLSDVGWQAVTTRNLIVGFAAGSVGAAVTWAGVAWAANRWSLVHLILLAVAGGTLGLLLPLAMDINQPLLLYIPWQSGIGAMVGLLFGVPGERKADDISPYRAKLPVRG